jgi:hypothetical protein
MRDELAARARGVIMTGWAVECRHEEWCEKRREYSRRYRLRHPERLHAMQLIYKARWKARQLGLEPPPLPDWDTELGGFEIQFARGGRPKAGIAQLFPSSVGGIL